MAKRLVDNLTTNYLEAAQRLNSKQARRKIVAYVEGYDDILFWRTLLSNLATDRYYFEVMLPSRTSLQKGKKSALMNTLGQGLGQYMIACVDADYDYLMQGATDISNMVCNNPYVFHTYAYAIENFQCYAPALHNVCVMSTLNDRELFDFESFMIAYSKLVFPLLVWSVWCYRHGHHSQFSMADLCMTVGVTDFNLQNPEKTLERLARKVNVKVGWLQQHFPQAKGTYQKLRDELQDIGVTPETTYLYMRGHDVFEKVVTPILIEVCKVLRREREREIRRLANHSTQRQNELAGYQHASAEPEEMLRKHTEYYNAPLYQRIQQDVQVFLEHMNDNRPNEPVLKEERYYKKPKRAFYPHRIS